MVRVAPLLLSLLSMLTLDGKNVVVRTREGCCDAGRLPGAEVVEGEGAVGVEDGVIAVLEPVAGVYI